MRTQRATTILIYIQIEVFHSESFQDFPLISGLSNEILTFRREDNILNKIFNFFVQELRALDVILPDLGMKTTFYIKYSNIYIQEQ